MTLPQPRRAAPWVVSTGTHRQQDLAPAFLDALREVAFAHYAAYLTLSGGPIPAAARADDDDPWWHSEECVMLLDSLQLALEAAAPAGTYFGAHPDDGAAFGFWPVDDDD